MNSNWRSMRLVAAVAVVAMIFAACGSSKSKTQATTGGATSTSAVAITDGGTLTVGAEQEPDCFDWLDACGGSSWGSWMGQYQTVPRAFDPIPQGGGVLKNVPGAVLAGAPTFSATPVETITYKINPKAVWSDGIPITCDDFAYTVDQQQHGKNLYDTTGYLDIAKVDCTDETSPVVTYKAGKTFSGWQALFGGGVGVLPSHILKGKDRDALMKNGYTWSGGPWIAKWTKGDNITLTPNPSTGARSRTSTASSSSSRPTPPPSSRRSSRTRCRRSTRSRRSTSSTRSQPVCRVPTPPTTRTRHTSKRSG